MTPPPRAGDERAEVNALWAAALVDALVAGGVRHVCVSPGSRSTPLAWAVAERADGAGAARIAHAAALTCSVHVDERSAAFFAVGYAAATGDAVALVCTSGTAAANYLPAVVEAHHGRLPIVVLTADRPAELRDRGAWQAIDQVKLYGSFVRWYHELAEADARPEALRYAAAAATRAVATALAAPRGPVHLNVPLREPLGPLRRLPAGVPSSASEGPSADGATAFAAAPAPSFRFAAPDRRPEALAVAELAARIAAEPRGLIVAGRPALDEASGRAVRALAAAAGYPLLAEPLSGLRFGWPAADAGVDAASSDADAASRDADVLSVTGYDAFLRPDAGVDVPSPGLVVRVGGSVTWKHVADYLGRASGAFQAAIDPDTTWDDPTGRVELRIAAPTGATCAALVEALAATRASVAPAAAHAIVERTGAPEPAPGDGAAWRVWWRSADAAVRRVRAAHGGSVARDGTGWLYPALSDLLPPDAVLFVANSMAVRDLDTYGAPSAKRIVPLCNRGAAGIDGTLSSALGAAFGARRPAALVTGDLAFLHDAGGFGVVADLARRYGRGAIDLFVVIVDDGGGGIFEHLPVAGADRARFEAFFATPQTVELAALCAAWGVPCRAAPDAEALRAAAAVDAPVRAALVTIDRARNTAAHRAYWRAVNDAVAVATRAPSAA